MTWKPEERDYKGNIVAGAHYSYDAVKAAYAEARVTDFPLTEPLLLRHTLILGTTGSGKTTHANYVIRSALESCPEASCFIVDVKKEYRKLAGSPGVPTRIMAIGDKPAARFNPLVPPKGVSPALWERAFADVFIRAYGLAEPSRRILVDSLTALRRRRPGLHPTLRELEREVGDFEVQSSNERNTRRSLESRLHLVNAEPLGDSLNAEEGLDPDAPGGRLTIFEIGFVDSMRDQRFLAEVVLMHMWHRDMADPPPKTESLRRLIVIEEAHRYLSEERPPNQRGDRTLLERTIAEARRYGWGFLAIDQMPLLLSRYVMDNMGTLLVHRLANMQSYELVKDAMGGIPTSQAEYAISYPIALRMPEDLAMFRRYADPGERTHTIGITKVPKLA